MAAGFKRSHSGMDCYDMQQHNKRQEIRYSDLTPEAKLQMRREERRLKKEDKRILSYFLSMENALAEQPAEARVALIDGFFLELIRLLRSDPSLRLLRNRTICHTVEMALTMSTLLQAKSVLYVLLGSVYDLIVSPTACRTLEALISSIVRGVSELSNNGSTAFAAEMADGDIKSSSESDVPSAATLVTCVVNELSERAEEILSETNRARAVRCIIHLLGGLSENGTKSHKLSEAARFSTQLDVLGTALMNSMYSVFQGTFDLRDTNILFNAARTPSTSFILQSLLRVCVKGSGLDAAVRRRLEDANKGDYKLFLELLMDPLGCHVFQAYFRVQPPQSIIEACDTLANRRAASTPLLPSNTSHIHDTLRDVTKASNGTEEGELDAVARKKTCWDKALKFVVGSLNALLTRTPGSHNHIGYAFHDLALFAPTAIHLERLWNQVLCPHLRTFLSSPYLGLTLVGFAQKCAFTGPTLVLGEDDCGAFRVVPQGSNGGGGTCALPRDIEERLCQSVAKGARYFSVSGDFQRGFLTALCQVTRELSTKGVAQYLLVDGGLEETGLELARYILHFNPSVCSMFINAIDKLCLADVESLLKNKRGSLVFQQYVRAGASYHSQKKRGNEAEKKPEQRSVPLRFLRRIKPLLSRLVCHKYAAFVVEVLYEVSTLEVKEELMKCLVPVYQSMWHGHGNTTRKQENKGVPGAHDERDGMAAESADCPDLSEFIARKVMKNCCVELYIHRREDWMKLARRQYQTQLLLHQVSAALS
uniref:Uncharacterized protein n=1 Tax=Trypanosoma vivax (strain Y486) TaxID=1055687 RepID=G0U5I9_TRYVY|nr:conserved hypothetical protein [Trypanosoma vivax Y486]